MKSKIKIKHKQVNQKCGPRFIRERAMKKIIIGFIISLFALSASADHEQKFKDYFFSQVPALCGSPDDIDVYVNHFNFKPYHISLGREGMVKDGQPVYMITYYINEEGNESMVTIDVPSGREKCILFHTFDLSKPQ